MVQWITENWKQIFTAIGFIYAAARIVVVLTPTPKDNEALDKVAGWLKGIAKIFGLDLTQGINKDV